MATTAIDINCDMGEGMPNDAAIVPYISSANIACGAHAGDKQTMEQTIILCLQHGVAVGAHPSFADRPNFGRTEMQLPNNELYDLVLKQLDVFATIANRLGAVFHHVKPHGALYNMSARNPAMAATVAKAVFNFDKHLLLYGLSESYLISEAKALGLKTASEVFADRTYQPDGQLTPRSQPNALVQSDELVLAQVLQMVQAQTVTSTAGTNIPLTAQTICIHGDGESAEVFARKIYNTLNEKNILIGAV